MQPTIARKAEVLIRFCRIPKVNLPKIGDRLLGHFNYHIVSNSIRTITGPTLVLRASRFVTSVADLYPSLFTRRSACPEGAPSNAANPKGRFKPPPPGFCPKASIPSRRCACLLNAWKMDSGPDTSHSSRRKGKRRELSFRKLRSSKIAKLDKKRSH
jgi:hypothetical protein